MVSSRFLKVRFRSLNLPAISLLALLQRTPVLQVATSAENFVLNSPLAAVLRSALAVSASVGAVHSLAGATALAVSPTKSPLNATVGTAISTQAMAVTGAQSTPASYTISSVMPPGLTLTCGTSTVTATTTLPTTVNGATLTLTGTPTTPGTYNIGIKAWQNANGKGDVSSTFTYQVVVVAAAASAPSFTTQPQSQTILLGDSVTFSAAVTGTPTPSYQWRKDGVALSGQTSTTLTISSVAATDAGTYTLVATNSAGAATSADAVLTVTPLAVPSFTTQPQSQTVSAGTRVVFTVVVAGAPTPTLQWRKDGVDITGATTSSLAVSNAQSSSAGTYSVVATNRVGATTSSGAILTVTSATAAAPEMPASFGAYASGAAEVTGSWLAPTSGATVTGYKLERATNAAFSTALTTLALTTTATSYVDATVTAGTTYYYRLSATNAAGSSSPTATVTVSTPASDPAGTASFANIATRAYCGIGNSVTIGGFVISGTASKRVLVRAVGPSLTAQGLASSEVLQDPKIEVHSGAPVIATNDNLADNLNAAEVVSAGAAVGATALLASDTKSSALLVTLTPGVYSFVVSGNNETSGIVLLEVYDADAVASGTNFANIATRAYCTTNNGVTIGGFVVSGTARKKVLMRAMGPTLTTMGIGQAEVLADPVIELHDALNGNTLIATNDNAADNANAAAMLTTGSRIGATAFAASDTTSAALLLTLRPGVYSFIARGKSAAPSGILLLEVYDAD